MDDDNAVTTKAFMAILGCLADELSESGLIDHASLDARLHATAELCDETGNAPVGSYLRLSGALLLQRHLH
ncbi:hypothetical protein CLG96_03855 [Sphingomonas oleivorans]|uniref:Uncharacterized protein n=1 Tax=Sphingomonas oleivorans TaxID=1735121 RepID=A0A2T5G281_9SPHN|nr:hypothetical protein [Sphingomonas oleivorans]PTQ13259.1 hypothetical protein CLG96_03855 [Sphingomonas oleivorans]